MIIIINRMKSYENSPAISHHCVSPNNDLHRSSDSSLNTHYIHTYILYIRIYIISGDSSVGRASTL